MTGSASVGGEGISDVCILHAGMLNLRIYETPRGSLPSELQTYWDINQQHWTERWVEERSDGFRCAFYTPTEAQQSGGSDSSVESLCPPVLVFRGSDSEPEDFAELAFATRLDLEVHVAMPLWYDDVNETTELDTSFSSSDDHSGKTMQQMDASGLVKEPLFENVSGTERFTIDGPLWFNPQVTINWEMDAALYYGTNGDWAVDFAQGLGRETGQYAEAIIQGRRAAAEAMRDWGGRLIITGHSLGGGLASCAGIAIRSRSEFGDLRMHVRTYNAAGLHANSARRAGGTLGTASEGPTRAEHVKDEILNSLQGSIIPILNDLLRWGGKSLPPAVPVPMPSAGISPGPMSISGIAYAPKGDRLPVLFPLERQTLCEPAFSAMTDIAGLANSAPRVQDFIRELLRYLVRGMSGGGQLTGSQATELRDALAAGDVIPDDLGPQIQQAIMGGGTPPTIELGNSDYFNNIAEPFVNGLVTDLVNFARILLASGEYHTFPPCGFTLILPRLS